MTAGLAMVVLLPVLSALAPWRIELPHAVFSPITQDAGDDGVVSPERESSPPVLPTSPGVEWSATPLDQATSAAPSSADAISIPPKWTRARVLNALLFVWLGGAALLLARLALSRRRVRRLVDGGAELTDVSWTTPLMEVADRLDLPELPRLVIHDDAAMPLTCGIAGPAIVLPPEAAQWTDERRRAVLCHELAHVRRRDLLSHLLGRLACALYWFQPLAWSAARRMRAESERACDDLVLITGTRASTYAEHLLQIVTSVRRVSAPVVALPMAQPREFEARLLSILDPRKKREPLSPVRAAALLALVGAIALPLVALSPVPPAVPAPVAGASPQDDDGEREQQNVAAEAPSPNAVSRAQASLNTPRARPAGAAAGAGVGSGPGTQFSGTRTRTVTQQIERTVEDIAHSVSDVAADAVNTGLASVLGGQQQSQDPRVRAALIRALSDSSAEVARAAAWALATHHDTEVGRALAAAVRNAADATVREMAVWSLVQHGSSAAGAEALAHALNDRDPEVRTTAAWGLGNLRHEAGVAALERAVRGDVSGDVRMAAAWALGQFGDRSSIAALNEALSFRDPDVRHAAAWSLGQIAAQPAPANLLVALRDTSSSVREVAAWSLGRIGDPATAVALRNALSDADKGVRRAAIWALGHIGGDAGIDALTAALRDSDAEVRASAAAALGGRGPQPWPWPWPWPMPRISP